jgi:hypothetical protein
VANPLVNLEKRPDRKCTAHSAVTKQPCKRYAIKGGTVCHFHGGGSPAVRAAADARLRAMVDPMISRLYDLAMQTDNLKVASDCVRDALDRAGIGDLVQAKVRAADQRSANTGSGITVNIGFLGSAPTEPALQTIDVIALPLPADHGKP